MLNEALYSCLVELGADENKAREAAKENKRIAKILEYVSQLYLQSASMNSHICDVDRKVDTVGQQVSVIDDRLTRFEQKVDERFQAVDKRFDRVESDVSTLKTDVSEIKGTLKLILEKLS